MKVIVCESSWKRTKGQCGWKGKVRGWAFCVVCHAVLRLTLWLLMGFIFQGLGLAIELDCLQSNFNGLSLFALIILYKIFWCSFGCVAPAASHIWLFWSYMKELCIWLNHTFVQVFLLVILLRISDGVICVYKSDLGQCLFVKDHC